jgi:hypothetical protein
MLTSARPSSSRSRAPWAVTSTTRIEEPALSLALLPSVNCTLATESGGAET